MEPRVIRDHHRRKPFRPFRIHVSDGSFYDIRQQRRTLLVSRRELVIFLDPDEDGIPQRTVRVVPESITRIEPIEDNGSGNRPER